MRKLSGQLIAIDEDENVRLGRFVWILFVRVCSENGSRKKKGEEEEQSQFFHPAKSVIKSYVGFWYRLCV